MQFTIGRFTIDDGLLICFRPILATQTPCVGALFAGVVSGRAHVFAVKQDNLHRGDIFAFGFADRELAHYLQYHSHAAGAVVSTYDGSETIFVERFLVAPWA